MSIKKISTGYDVDVWYFSCSRCCTGMQIGINHDTTDTTIAQKMIELGWAYVGSPQKNQICFCPSCRKSPNI